MNTPAIISAAMAAGTVPAAIIVSIAMVDMLADIKHLFGIGTHAARIAQSFALSAWIAALIIIVAEAPKLIQAVIS